MLKAGGEVQAYKWKAEGFSYSRQSFLKYIFQLTVRSVDICLMVATIIFLPA